MNESRIEITTDNVKTVGVNWEETPAGLWYESKQSGHTFFLPWHQVKLIRVIG